MKIVYHVFTDNLLMLCGKVLILHIFPVRNGGGEVRYDNKKAFYEKIFQETRLYY